MKARAQPASSATTQARAHRRWWRWALGGVVGAVLLAVLAAVALVAFTQSPAPLALPAAQEQPTPGPIAGTWMIAPGSRAGFRIAETALFVSNDVVGRTAEVNGSVRLAAHAIDAAHARVDVRALTVGGTHKPQLATALATRVYPFATFDLGGPVALDPSFASGGEVSTTARGMLTVRGVSRGVTFALKARLNGTMIDLLGTARLVLARWGVKPPAGFGPLGSLAGEARAEFLVLLSRSARGA